jgi:polar amino acid transport system substrate-binding protein
MHHTHHHSEPRARRRRGVLLAGTMAFTLLAAACGDDIDKADTAATTTGAVADSKPADSAPADSAGELPGVEFNQALHDALPKDILDKGVLTLATDPTDPPLEFFNDANEIVGAEVDVANALSVIFGIKVELVSSKFDAIIPGIEAGRFDGSLSGFADRVERQKVVDFVDFYKSSRAYLIQTGTFPELEDATDLCGRNVAVAKGTTMADAIPELSDACTAAGKEAIEGQIFPDQSACVLAVQSARSDLTILSDHAALAIAQGSDGALDVILRPNEGNDINGIVLRKGDLVEPMQKAIQGMMDSGALLAIFTEWNLQDLMLTEATVNAGVN